MHARVLKIFSMHVIRTVFGIIKLARGDRADHRYSIGYTVAACIHCRFLISTGIFSVRIHCRREAAPPPTWQTRSRPGGILVYEYSYINCEL